MIGYLQGEILENQDGKLMIGIGDRKASGVVGYAVSVPQNASYPLLGTGSPIELFVYTHVREDSLELYGFSSKFEKVLFLLLLNVNGIGPKSALSILSAAEPRSLVDAIIRGDQAFLTHLPGIGKKTAERVVLELKDVLKKKLDSGAFGTVTLNRVSIGGQSASSSLGAAAFSESTDDGILRDARAALVGLGYRDHEVDSLLSRALGQLEVPPKRVEDLVKSVLRQLV
jgi:Holliday junction DNA helicase RuvA